MRTTLTIEDDLASILKQRASEEGQSFKEVVNNLLRAGIAASESPSVSRKPVIVATKPLGLKPGYDPDKLNQLVDELEVEGQVKKRHTP